MKVLQIDVVCGVGSTGRIVSDIHNYLKSNKIESCVAYGREESKNCDKTIKIGNKFGIYWHVFMTRFFDKHGFSSKRATLKLIEKIEEYNPDIIHLNNLHGYYLNIEILFQYLKESNKKIFWTLHDCWDFTGHCAYFDLIKCTKWKTECNRCPQLDSYPSSYFWDNSKSNYYRKKENYSGVKNLTIITPSEWLSNLVKESFLKEYPVVVINNGIDTDIFKKRESKIRDKLEIRDKFIILGVASPWSKRKGFEDFLELSKMLEEDEIIIMVGLSKEQILKLPKNIIGLEKTNSAVELSELYSTANIFFNPTYEDNYPTVNLEALSCGTPVITYNTGGSPECITTNNGYIVEQGDIKKALLKMREINMDYKVIYDEREKFSKDNFVKKILNEYKK